VTGEPVTDSSDFVHRVETVLLDRMDRLERENRRLRRFGNLSLIGMAIILGLAAAVFWFSGRFGTLGGVPENLVARQFSLRDGRGATRGTWSVADDGTVRLLFNDGQGRARVRVSVLPDGSSGFTFADSTDHRLLVLGVLPDQSVSLVMSDNSGTPRAVLGLSGGGAANLVFADRSGSTKAGIGIDQRGLGTLTMTDRGASRQIEEFVPEPDSASDTTDSQPSPPPKPGTRKK
jgi:hypothetical protein